MRLGVGPAILGGHEEAKVGLEQARRGVALSKLGAAGLQQMLERMASEASSG